MEPIKILFLSADPTATLDTNGEFRRVYEAIQGQQHFEVLSRDHVYAGDLQRILRETIPHILHFSGHGVSGRGDLVTQRPQGGAQTIPLDALADMLAVLKGRTPTRLVVLNACWSLERAEPLCRVVDAVVGMTDDIGDDAAAAFAEGFYLDLCRGGNLITALGAGKAQIKALRLPDGPVPAYLVRNGLTPEQINLGRLRQAAPKSSLPPPSPNPRMKDHLFVSYAHADRTFVEHLAKDLRERGHVVWIDFEGIPGGDTWQQAISDGISASAVFLIIISPDSVKSEWVQIELDGARKFNKKVIPLLVHPLQDARAKAGYRRLKLEATQYIDFSADYDQGFRQLPDVLPRPKAGVPGHCQRLVAQFAARPWGLDHFIQSPAKLLPIDASPYEDGAVKGAPERLLERLRQAERLLILGEPGMGKTVALERLAWELASADPPVLPIYVALRDYDGIARHSDGVALLDWVRLSLIALGEIQPEVVEDIEHFLRKIPFQVYFLLDGLNEVRSAHREKILSEITRLAMEFPAPDFRLAVTSRVQDDSWRSLRQGNAVRETYLVQPISTAQACQYLIAHLENDELWGRLDERMRGLATTPLLLWLIKEAWLESRDVPGNRGALYGSFVTRMLRRDDERKLTVKVPHDKREVSLERLAAHLHSKKGITLEWNDAVEIVGDGETLELLLVNGLLAGEKMLRFAPHQTMQEHFAARSMMKQEQQQYLPYADDPWWAETFIQLAGLTADPNQLAQAVADKNPWLAWWCVEEGGQVYLDTRKAIEARSIALIRSPKVQERRGAALALAKFGSEHTIPPLVQLARDEDTETGGIALNALIPFGGAIVPKLLPSLIDVTLKPPIRARIGRWLGKTGDPRPGVLDFNWGGAYWCFVPKSKFIMGSDQDSDNPRREADVPYDFWIAKYPITYRQFQAFIDASDGYRDPQWWQGLHADGLKQQQGGPGEQNSKFWNHPAENVSWYDAIGFCRWLSARLDYAITLPTEEQWEKAARGADGRIYPYGDTFDATKGNVYETGIGQTSAVGIFPDGASLCGALDMSGNVWEWTLTEYESQNSNDLSDRHTRAVRGGAWFYHQYSARAASRSWNLPDTRRPDFGFRVVCRAARIPPSAL